MNWKNKFILRLELRRQIHVIVILKLVTCRKLTAFNNICHIEINTPKACARGYSSHSTGINHITIKYQKIVSCSAFSLSNSDMPFALKLMLISKLHLSFDVNASDSFEWSFQMWLKTGEICGHLNLIRQFFIYQLKNSGYLSHLRPKQKSIRNYSNFIFKDRNHFCYWNHQDWFIIHRTCLYHTWLCASTEQNI